MPDFPPSPPPSSTCPSTHRPTTTAQATTTGAIADPRLASSSHRPAQATGHDLPSDRRNSTEPRNWAGVFNNAQSSGYTDTGQAHIPESASAKAVMPPPLEAGQRLTPEKMDAYIAALLCEPVATLCIAAEKLNEAIGHKLPTGYIAECARRFVRLSNDPDLKRNAVWLNKSTAVSQPRAPSLRPAAGLPVIEPSHVTVLRAIEKYENQLRLQHRQAGLTGEPVPYSLRPEYGWLVQLADDRSKFPNATQCTLVVNAYYGYSRALFSRHERPPRSKRSRSKSRVRCTSGRRRSRVRCNCSRCSGSNLQAPRICSACTPSVGR